MNSILATSLARKSAERYLTNKSVTELNELGVKVTEMALADSTNDLLEFMVVASSYFILSKLVRRGK